MSNGTLIAVVVISVVLLALIGAVIWRVLRTRRLRDHFGPEYDHTVASSGDRRHAERELERRQKHFKELELRPLSTNEQRELSARWKGVQTEFVDRPESAVATADTLITEAMRARGYPLENEPQRQADLSVELPREILEYRSAREIAEHSARGEASTEDLRRAMVHYRTLFSALLASGHEGDNNTQQEVQR